eukprot:TRINITY_DN25349_c0_g1_i2.p1 TRINITY_DN25349_c0_g1~~TRINITY_DN25349_c0_g1_i2.p1  ORF type:complete len:252 (+),score=21.46 TRINITY_DN25349_c0_g1_i2:32-757(+)
MGRSTLRAACLAGCLWLLLGGLPSGMSRSALILRSLHRYPVKSCAGHESAEARIARDGLLGDRSYVVSWQGQGLTQRECPRLAAIQTELDEQHLRLSSASTTQAPLEVPFREEGADTRSSIFGASINGVDQGEEAASWISEFVDKPGCRLLRRSAGCKRQAVGYHWADIAPLLVVSTASLQGLSGSAQKDSEHRKRQRVPRRCARKSTSPAAIRDWQSKHVYFDSFLFTVLLPLSSKRVVL